MNKMQKTIISIAIVIIVSAGSFYGGMIYAQSKNKKTGAPGFNGQMPMGFNGQALNQNGRPSNGNNMANGEIISQDDKTVTLKLGDGGSKIIFFSDSTQIMKSTSGTITDLTAGQNLMVTGTTNTDGSITAQTIQIRPQQPANAQQPGNQTQPADLPQPPNQ